jgi:hypothetical protein
MSGKSLESRVIDAIEHLNSVIARRGLINVSEETRQAYYALEQLHYGLTGSIEDGSAIVFYTP